jgi:hypothetical protein
MAYPDRALRYLQRKDSLVGLSIEDLSEVLFDHQVFAFAMRGSYQGHPLIAVGTDPNEELAASKCISEFIEKICRIDHCKEFEFLMSDLISTAFHPSREKSHENAERELIERYSLISHYFSPGVLSECALNPDEINFLEYENSDEILPKLYCIEVVEGYPLNCFEIYAKREVSERSCLGNGFSVGQMLKARSHGLLEAFRRYQANKAFNKRLPSINEYFLGEEGGPLIRDNTIEGIRKKVISKQIEIKNIGTYSLMALQGVPGILNPEILFNRGLIMKKYVGDFTFSNQVFNCRELLSH